MIAFGQDVVPAFCSAQSAHKATLLLDDTTAIARAQKMRTALGLPGGQLIANPILAGTEITHAEMDPVIERLLGDAETHGISLKYVTPYPLWKIYELTKVVYLPQISRWF